MLRWTDDAWNDYLYWQVQDKKTLKRVNALIRDAMRSPFAGLGKPEPLKWELQGAWSRRIDSAGGRPGNQRLNGCLLSSHQ